MMTLNFDISTLKQHQLDALLNLIKSLREPHYIKTHDELTQETAVQVIISAPPELPKVAPNVGQLRPEWE
jgi:hypothetical protein